MVKISIIVPIYNAEMYLIRLLNSLIKQTFTDFEVILINDGSLDSSGTICDEISKRDNRFCVIHKKNEGVSIARQTGLDVAQGEYVIHADADDWVEPKMLEDMLEIALCSNADIVLADFYVETESGTKYIKQESKNFNSIIVLQEILKGSLHGSLWNKLVRRSIFEKYKIRFLPEINYCEDILIWVDILQRNVSIAYLARAYYHYDYVINPDSITRNYTIETVDQRKKYVAILECKLAENFKTNFILIKLNIKFEIFEKDVLSNKQFKEIYPEVTKNSFSLRSTLINRLLLYIASIGLKNFSFKVYKLKNKIKRI